MKVLITSGGGAKGAFTVGALQFLRDKLNISRFDLISGTSTGALIATLATIEGGLDTLIRIYSTTSNNNVLQPVNVVTTLTGGGKSLFNTDPLLAQINNQIDPNTFNAIMQANTKLCLNTVSLQTGKLNVFSTRPINSSPYYENFLINTRDMMTQVMLASSNQPAFMPPVRIGNQDLVDGGTREVIPTRVVVNNLPDTEDHEIYVLSNNPDEMFRVDDSKVADFLKILLRTISIFIQEVRENDLETLATFRDRLVAAGRQVKIFYICPPSDLDPEFSTGLRFDVIDMGTWMDDGSARAKSIIQNNPNGNFTGKRAF
jgi:predicted acylesterase/phospholipase RssA